jgi:hypothetical protein
MKVERILKGSKWDASQQRMVDVEERHEFNLEIGTPISYTPEGMFFLSMGKIIELRDGFVKVENTAGNTEWVAAQRVVSTFREEDYQSLSAQHQGT